MTQTADLIATALDAAEAAARVHSEWEGRIPLDEATLKGTSDFVSRVDLDAQDAALRVIRERFPDHEVLSEEDAAEEARSGSTPARADVPLWIVDPLDGTTNFLHRHPFYSASVGLAIRGEPLVGAVVAGATGERWWAAKGDGAFKDGKPIHVSAVQHLHLALIGTGFPFKRLAELPTYLRELDFVLPACMGIRRGGCASLDLCYLAQGSLDAFWETRLEPWDVAAGLVILSEAGGLARRKDGSRFLVEDAGSVLAANSSRLLAALQDRLEAAKLGPPKDETPAG